MPSYDLTGIVKCVMEPKTFSSGFTKREFVITTEGDRFPQEIMFECVKERCALLDTVQPGQRVAVTFDVRGREYNERYFVNLAAWKIQPAGAAEGAPAAGDGGNMPPMSTRVEPSMDGDDEIMPF